MLATVFVLCVLAAQAPQPCFTPPSCLDEKEARRIASISSAEKRLTRYLALTLMERTWVESLPEEAWDDDKVGFSRESLRRLYCGWKGIEKELQTWVPTGDKEKRKLARIAARVSDDHQRIKQLKGRTWPPYSYCLEHILKVIDEVQLKLGSTSSVSP